MPAPSSADMLARFMALHPKKIDLSLGRMHTLMAKLGNPERRLPPVIHIAGTNGKGSTAAAIRAMAEAAGLRVHAYSSPHLVHFRERIRLAGQLIDEQALLEVLTHVDAKNDGDPITFFEITTAAAFMAMADTPADLVILEVGLGGRLDATNILDDCAAAVITPIGLDHQDFLGDRLEDIAGEKAGIMRKNRPAVIAAQRYEALSVLRKHARNVGADCRLGGIDWQLDLGGGDTFRLSDADGALDLPKPNLAGSHQIFNAGLAVAAVRAQRAVHIPDAAIRAGLGWIRWPGRLQPVADTPLNALLPKGAALWLDGGHNGDAGQVLRGFLRGLDAVDQPVTVIVGMMKNKDARAFLEPISTQAARLIAVPIAGEASMPPAALAATASDLGMQGTVASGIEAALKQVSIESHPERPPAVLLTGSLYLVGQALSKAGLIPE